MAIVLSRPGVFKPKEKITNSDLEKLVDTSDEWIVSRTGIKERRISFDKGSREMGAISSENVLKETGTKAERIMEIMLATNFHDFGKGVPEHATYVADQLGIKEARNTDLFGGCTGLIYRIRDAYNALSNERYEGDILVVGTEWMTNYTDYSDRSTCILFGDGAGSYLLRRDDNTGDGIINVAVRGRIDNKRFIDEDEREGVKLVSKLNGEFQTKKAKQYYLTMRGPRVKVFARDVLYEVVHEVLDGTKYGLKEYGLKDVDVIIPHGANGRIVEEAGCKLREDGFRGELYTNLDRFGNTSNASIPIAEYDAIRDGVLTEDSLSLIAAFGSGLNWGAVLKRGYF